MKRSSDPTETPIVMGERSQEQAGILMQPPEDQTLILSAYEATTAHLEDPMISVLASRTKPRPRIIY
jgi:hypothetical protein